MNLQNPPSKPTPEINIKEYTGLLDIFRSWFWRYYDHLLQLLLINLGWFLSCFGLGWLCLHFGWVGPLNHINPLEAFGLYLLEAMVSIGWAYMVFKLFNEDQVSFKNDFWEGLKDYFWKAMGVSAFSGLLVVLAFYNIRFYFHLQSAHRLVDLLMAGIIIWFMVFWAAAALLQWPILFFQNPPFFRIFYRSFLLVLSNGLISFGLLIYFAASFLFFDLVPVIWYFIGPVFFFSFQCVALEKHYLKYKIIYNDKPLEPFLEGLNGERQRGWRDFLRPWENR